MSAMSIHTQSHAKYDKLIATAKAVPSVSTVVVHPCDETPLRGAVDSAEAGIIQPVLVGPEPKIRNVAAKHGLDISSFEIIDAAHSEAAAAKGVELIHAAKGEVLMKGQPAHRRTDAQRYSKDDRVADRAARQPCVHHGCMPTPCL